MTPIARENLFASIPRFLIAQAGILFAVSLVTLQTGIFAGFTHSVSELITRSRANIWVASENVVHLGLTIPLPYERLSEVMAMEGVEQAEALIFRNITWRNPRNQLVTATLIGINPEGQLFAPLNTDPSNLKDLQTSYTVLVDGRDLAALYVNQVGDRVAIGSLPARIVGLTQGLRSIVFSPMVFTSLESATAYTTTPTTPRIPCDIAIKGVSCEPTDDNFPPALSSLTASNTVSYVLIRAREGTDLDRLKQRLAAKLPDTRVLTRSEMADLNQHFWEVRSGIGVVLGLGAVIGVVVGVVIVGQILYASVSEHIRQFGTLKAMGASKWFIYRVIGEQALWMAVLGYIPGIALSLGVAEWAATQGILILISPVTAVCIFGVTVLMCFGASGFAIRKVMRVDPAMVFRS